jgi:3-phosphoshikimate 1-carboxyvinyltransferase
VPTYSVEPLSAPLDATVRVPGSKSFTNRALVTAALAVGRSEIAGALVADDTAAMTMALEELGVVIVHAEGGTRLEIDGVGAGLAAGPRRIDARLSGTTSRFLLPLLALGEGPYVLDGAEPLRRRPMGPTVDALRGIGAQVSDMDEGPPGHLPLEVSGRGTRGGAVSVPGDLSSQFVSGLLLSGPLLPEGLDLTVTGTPVSRPYLDMTVATMEAFGASVARPEPARFVVSATGYRPSHYAVEPDASAASYFLAAAAMRGGKVTIEGLGSASIQGDRHVVDVLAAMGADVHVAHHSTTVRATGRLRGVDVDLSDMPDMAQTIAVVAAVAEGESRVRGVDIIRYHETDRIAGVVTELRRCGVGAEETDDGFIIRPAPIRPAVVQTYDDHRMAMSFALLGLVAPGIEIADPGCVAKTFPDYFAVLDGLRSSGTGHRQ